MTIRLIQKEDNEQVAQLIRDVMTEFGAVGEGYSIMDPEVDAMYEHYNDERSAFFVIEENSKILGCAGIGPLKGGTPLSCELKKMYFYPELRGKGMGREIVKVCLEAARARSYKECYLETIESMETANKLYQRSGFQRLQQRMGDTGHSACDVSYLLKL